MARKVGARHIGAEEMPSRGIEGGDAGRRIGDEGAALWFIGRVRRNRRRRHGEKLLPLIEDETAGFNGVVIRRSKEGEEERSRCTWGNMVLLLGRWAAGRGGARAQPKANRRRALASGWAWRTGICPACAFLWLHPEKKGLNVGPTWHRNDKIMKRAAAKKIPERWGPLAIEKREIAAGSWAGIAGS